MAQQPLTTDNTHVMSESHKKIYELADILFNLNLTEEEVPKSVLLQVVLHYRTLQNMLQALVHCGQDDSDREMVIYKQVDLDFDYKDTYDLVKSIEQGQLVLDSMSYLDEELQGVQAFLRDPEFFPKENKTPSTQQKKDWSTKICNQIMNS